MQILIMLCGLFGASTAVIAAQPMAPAPLPEYEVGDRLVWQSADRSWSEVAIEVENGVVTWEASDGEVIVQPRNFALPPVYFHEVDGEEGGFVVERERGELFPLVLGNHTTVDWRLADAPDMETQLRICTVVGIEEITVPAGTFDTYKVNCQQQNRTKTYSYAPALGTIVRYVNTHRLLGSDEQVLVRFERAGSS